MELWDKYDVNRQRLGETHVRGGYVAEDDLFLVVHVCIINSENKMLIQQRQPDKPIWADRWDFTAGGTAISGENSAEAIHRELSEEMGIDYDFSGVRPRFTVNFEHGFDDFYIIRADIEASSLVLQTEEVKAAKWASRDEIFDMIDRGEFIPYYKSLIDMIFDMRDDMGTSVRTMRNY